MIDVTKLEVPLPIWIAEAIQEHCKVHGVAEIILPARMYNDLKRLTGNDGWHYSQAQTTWQGVPIRRCKTSDEAVIIGYDGVSRTI